MKYRILVFLLLITGPIKNSLTSTKRLKIKLWFLYLHLVPIAFTGLREFIDYLFFFNKDKHRR